MKTLLKQVCSLILALLMVLSVVSVPTFSAKAEDGENPPSAMTLNEALNVEGGNIEFTNSGDYIDSENGNYIWIVEDDHIASPEPGLYQKKAVITAEITANEGEIVAFDFICDVLDYTYVSGGLLFSIDDISPESGKGYGYAGFYYWTHKEYALTAGKHTLKWVFCLSTGATGSIAKLDNVFVGEPVHPSQVILQDTAEVGVNCRTQLACEVLPAEAFNKSVAFSSSDENVAVVLEDGNVVGMKTGTATITAATVDGGLVDTCEVTVIESEVGSAELFVYYDIYSREQQIWHTALYNISSSLPEKAELIAELSTDETKGYNMVTCAYAGGKIYGYVTKGYSKFNYIVIDEKSQHVDYWGRTNLLFPRSMAYDYSTNTLYAIAYTSQSSSKNALYKVDIDTGDLTKIADFASGNVAEITISRDGKMYGLSYTTVYEINKTTGELTSLLRFTPTDGYTKLPTAAVYDFEAGLIYALFESRTDRQYSINYHLYRIDVERQTAISCGYVTVAPTGVDDIYIKNDIELPPREKTKFTVTFVDSMDGSVIDTAQYEVGTTLDEATFLTPPEHDGYAFTCWEYDENYDGEYLLYDVTATAYYHEAEAPATIIVNNNYDTTGSYYYWTTYGCQMLIDADATAYGTIIPEQRTWPLTVIEEPETFYDYFEYRLPEGASAEFSSHSSMYCKKQLINIPAGTYDWCFIAPTKADEGVDYLFMSDAGDIPACYDNYTFEAGFTYEFNVTHYNPTDVSTRVSKVELTVTRGNTEPVYTERIELVGQEVVVYGKRMIQYEIYVYPENAFDKQVYITSADETIAFPGTDILGDDSIYVPDGAHGEYCYAYGVSTGSTVFSVNSSDGHSQTEFVVRVPEVMPVANIRAFRAGKWIDLFDDNVFEYTTIRKEDSTYYVTAATYAGGKLFCFENISGSNRFAVKDAETLETLYTGAMMDRTVTAMAYNYANGKLYALAVNDELGTNNSLYEVSLPLGTLTEIAPIQAFDADGNPVFLNEFCIDKNGNAYGVNKSYSEPYLQSIDLTTGVCTIIGGTGMKSYAGFFDSNILPCGYMAFDNENGTIVHYDGLNGWGNFKPETGEYIHNRPFGSATIYCIYVRDSEPEIEIPPAPDFKITFVDDSTGESFEERTVQGGNYIDMESFPTPPEYDGLVFGAWDFFDTDKMITSDIMIRALYSDPGVQTAVVRLTDESGGLYQNPNGADETEESGWMATCVGWHMVFDADANSCGYGQGFAFSMNGGELCSSASELYSSIEYSIPRYAEAPVNASDSQYNYVESVSGETKSVRIPAGTYDWCILSLITYSYSRFIASNYGNISGCYDDFEFAAGYLYEFRIYRKSYCHAVDLTITKIEKGTTQDAGVCVLLGEIAGSPGEEIETEVVIEGDYEANSFDMALEYDASDIEVLEITPGQVIQEIVENGGEFDLEQFGPGSGPGEGGSGSPDASTGTIDAKAESGGMAFGGNGQIMKMKVKIPEDAEAGEKNMDMTVNDLSKNNSDGTTEQVPHYDVTGNSATGSIGGGGSGGSGGGSGSIGGGGGGGVVTDPTTPIPTGEPTPTGEPVPAPTPNPNASFFVTFVDWDGRTIAIKTAKYGEAATPPPDPERENFIFVGWEGDFSCVTANTAVLAKYGPIPNSGDASEDGTVNAVDALVAMRYVLGVSTESLTPEQIAAADFNGDGAVNAVDSLLIMRFSLGLIEAVVKEPVQDA